MVMSDPLDRSDAIVLRLDRPGARSERTRLEPRSDGRWDRYEDEWTGCKWRAVGHEIVDDIGLSVGDEVVQGPRGDGAVVA